MFLFDIPVSCAEGLDPQVVDFTPTQLSTLHQTCDLMPEKAAVMLLSAVTLQRTHNVMSSGQLSK